MNSPSPAFEQTYRKYLADLEALDMEAASRVLGLETDGEQALVFYLGRLYRVSPKGVLGPRCSQPDLGTCVVLCRYLLLHPESPVDQPDWTSFRDIRDAGPLTVFWANEVERAIAQAFAGKPDRLRQAALDLDGAESGEKFSYDVEMIVPALPRIPMLTLFNDQDEDFPAKCTVLFQKSARAYLDPECLAIMGGALARRLCGNVP